MEASAFCNSRVKKKIHKRQMLLFCVTRVATEGDGKASHTRNAANRVARRREYATIVDALDPA